MELEQALQHRAQVEEFRRRHRTGLVTLVFTGIVGSTAVKQRLDLTYPAQQISSQ